MAGREGKTGLLCLRTKITTPRLEESRDFYVRAFGMVVTEEWNEAGDRGVILALGVDRSDALLELHDGAASGLDGVGLQFRVESLDDFVARLPAGASYTGPTPRPWGATYVYIEDPNGIRVVAYEERS